ncbi:MAG: TraR/DksA C4-type zinc finger protein [Bacillota bacterium]
MLNSGQMASFRSQLDARKAEIEHHLQENQHFGLEQSFGHDSTGELSSYDNHPGDEGTELYEREKDIALNEHVEEELSDINRALAAIEKGTYGVCEVCGTDIPEERLEVLPTATTCKEHSPEQAISHSRPIEESILEPAFGQFEYDESDSEAYDAEDTYQDVERFGNSDTPSDMEYPVDSYNDVYMENDDPTGYVEDYENFAATDIEGKNVTVYPSIQHRHYEHTLDEEGLMTPFGDLPASEKEPYSEE